LQAKPLYIFASDRRSQVGGVEKNKGLVKLTYGLLTLHHEAHMRVGPDIYFFLALY